MDLMTLLVVGSGGALGTMARFAATQAVVWWLGGNFPYATMNINIVGSFLMGMLTQAASEVWSPSVPLLSFFKIGVLGGFTTFSSFSLDAVNLMNEGDWIGFTAYVSGSVVASIGGLVAGMMTVDFLFP
ncbi:putative fluoride ion transporter CrcB [uncultured Gammaproteobacteria bacterium]